MKNRRSNISRAQPKDSSRVKAKPSARGARSADPYRCQFLSSIGRQCQMPRSPRHRTLCVNHAKREEDRRIQSQSDKQVARELASLSGNFKTANEVNRVIGKVLSLLAKRRIPRREAVAFGYLGQLLLQTLPNVQREIKDALGYGAWQETVEAALGVEPDEDDDDDENDEEGDTDEEAEPDDNVELDEAHNKAESVQASNVAPGLQPGILSAVDAAPVIDPAAIDPDQKLPPDQLRAVAAAAFANAIVAAAQDEGRYPTEAPAECAKALIADKPQAHRAAPAHSSKGKSAKLRSASPPASGVLPTQFTVASQTEQTVQTAQASQRPPTPPKDLKGSCLRIPGCGEGAEHHVEGTLGQGWGLHAPP